MALSPSPTLPHTPTLPLSHTPTLPHPSTGSALVITLGLLAALALLVFAFTFSARTERFAARNDRDRVTARQYVDLALVQAMETLELNLRTPVEHQGQWYVFRPDGNPARFDRWNVPYDNDDAPFTRNAFASRSDGDRIDADFFNNFSTNLIPASLWNEMRGLRPHWIPISQIDESPETQSGSGTGSNVVGTNGYIAYAVINCSGFLDAHFVTSNQLAQLQADGDDIDDIGLFLRNRARDTAPGSVLTNYLSVHDLWLRNSGRSTFPSNLFTWSYDPGPDVTVTNGNVYSDRGVQLLSKLDVNSWTNGFAGDLYDLSDPSDLSDLSAHYASSEFRAWLADATNRFAAIGFAAPEALAWNLVNFMDADRIPQSDHPRPWQQPWPVEDVPLINEIAVALVPIELAPTNNHYAPAVELWYPFATNRITAADEARLVVAIYTNWPAGGIVGADWTNRVMNPAPDEGFSFTNVIEQMELGTDTEFVTATLPAPYISFPVVVTNAALSGAGPRYRPAAGASGSAALVEVDDDDPAGQYYLVTATNWLRLGADTYNTYVPYGQEEGRNVYVRRAFTVNNEIRLLARVSLNGHWVDEAMGYDPDDPARDELIAFTNVCGYAVNDPRRNGYPGDWVRYDAATMITRPQTDGADSPTDYACTLTGATNAICNPWHLPYGQGLPLVHFNQPLRRAGDIGYIQQPERFVRFDDRTRTITNLWQSICLADATLLATNRAGYAFAAGSVLEFFTARATNTPVRGLVHFSTTHTNVVRALMADLTVGWGANPAFLNSGGIDWMQEVFAATQEELYGANSIPIGVGDMCWGVGQVPAYRNIPAEHTGGEDLLRWQGSLGNDLKEDLLRGLAERISFRQHIFVVCLAGRTATPSGRISASQRAVAVVIRDAYTGRWQVVSWEWL